MELKDYTRTNLLIVISGPSGAGKSTVVDRLSADPEIAPGMRISVSATTRPPRPGEVNGVDYHFLTIEEFEKVKEQGGFLEWARVHNAFYGTPASNLDSAFSEKKDLVMEIDVQGARNVKMNFQDAALIFITAPVEEIRKRLYDRPTSLPPGELEKEIGLRAANASREMQCIPEYDYLVINENLDECIKSVISIIRAERCRITKKASG